MWLFGKSCSSAMLSPKAEEVDGRILGARGMFYFSESFKSLLVLSVLVETAVLPMKASQDLLGLLTNAQRNAVLGALSCKAFANANRQSAPFSSFHSRPAKAMNIPTS